MSLNAWEWEDEDAAIIDPLTSLHSFLQTTNDCVVEGYLGTRVQEYDYDGRYGTLGSLEEEHVSPFEPDVPQVVPCKFIISLAFPVNFGIKGKYLNILEKFKKHPKLDNHIAKLRRFYHIEYFLLPDDEEPKIVDMVIFPGMAKVFLDSGVKTIKPWLEGGKLWVSWSQSFNVNVTKELLKKMNFHKITLRLWDTKDKISKKVRYYRLKAASYLEEAGSFGKSEEVRLLVLDQRRQCDLSHEKASINTEEWDEERLLGKPEKAEKHAKLFPGSHQAEPEIISKNNEDYEKSLKMDDLSSIRRSTSRTPVVPLAGATMLEIKEFIEKKSLNSLTDMLEKQRSQSKKKDPEMKRRSLKKGKKQHSEEEFDPSQWRQSVFSLQLAIMPLLAGQQTVMSWGSDKSANILDCLLTFKTEVPIMTEEQKLELNPLIIRIDSVSCLPSQPVPIQELQRLCTPIYCRYRFHKTPVHRTEERPHGTHVYFEDINVICLGAIHPSDLREYLEGPPMVVEVHDRDHKSDESSRRPTLFGEDPLDSHGNIQSFISSKETEDNPFESQNKTWDPHGVARVSFADLLLGHKYLNLVVPIQRCEPKATPGLQGSRCRRVSRFQIPATEVLQHNPMPAGNYLEANSLLKLRVDVAVPLTTWAKAQGVDFLGSHFGRIVFVFSAQDLFLVHSLLKDITLINAKALELDSYPTGTVQQILSAFKMRVNIQHQEHLDVLTGFHLLDGNLHLFVLEGLADGGLRQLWESHQSRIPMLELRKYKVLYNSQLLFRHRLYADLETVLYHVHLFRPLSLLTRHPGLYLRDAIPHKAFQALARIYNICYHSTKLREVIVRDLLPSSAMIKDLSQEFGLPISQEDLMDQKLPTISPQPVPNLEGSQSQVSTLNSKILKNIMKAFQATKRPPVPKAKMMRISTPLDKGVHNYSVMTFNSAVLAKKELCQEMAKEPGRRFTYSQNYLSAIVEPQDSQEEKKKAQEKSRQAWLTVTGFQVTGLHGDILHQDFPLPAIEEFHEVCERSRVLDRLLYPMLDRGRWSWDRRHLDFELYKKPPPFLEVPIPSPTLCFI
uniref:Cilia and flagella associated protein 92 (putative) n=1 Tax=Marmota marmota marmota TaxID=9994 RepID=A0A8C6A6R8_MARMA